MNNTLEKGRKKILMISNGFYPEISPRSYRATELAKEFFRQGHDVTVFSKYRNFDYKGFLKDYPIQFKMWGKSCLPVIPNFKKRPFSKISSFISRILLVLFEYPVIEELFKVKKVLKHEQGYDMIISFAVPYPVHWGVSWSRSARHPIAETWIADCGDPYMGDVLDSFRKPFYFKYLEKRFCNRADYITIPVESARDGYYPEFHSKIRVISQGFNFEIKTKTYFDSQNPVPTFAYAGGFLPGSRDPGPLLEYLTSLDKPFRFIIYTNQPGIIDKYKSVLNNKIEINDYIPREELLAVLSKVDFLINFDNNTARNIPSKLIDYAIINRPVLNITKDLSPEDILAFLQGDYSKRMILPNPELYHIKNVSKLFLDLNK